MRISDWSSDVCSSDLLDRIGQGAGAVARGRIGERLADGGRGTRGGGFDRIGGHAFLAFLVPEIHRYGSRCSYRHVPVCIESGANPHATPGARSEEHTSELQSLMRISYAVFCLKKKKKNTQHNNRMIMNTKIKNSTNKRE